MKAASGALSRLILRVAPAAATACVLVAIQSAVLAPTASAAPVGTFQTRSSSPESVNNVAVDPTTNLIYAQGFDDTTFYSYNPSTDTWTTLASSPISQTNNGGGAYLNGKIYTVYEGNDSDMGVYDIASNTWTTVANPLGVGTNDITSTGGLLYIVEGNSFVSYNPSTSTTTTLADAPNFTGDCSGEGFSDWGGLAPLNGKIYGHQGNGCDGFAIYDIASNTWTLGPNVPGDAVLGSAIDPVSKTYFAYGSYGGDSFYRYDIASGSWSTITFPFSDIDDGGMAYVSTPGLEGIYATYGEGDDGFTRYVTPAPTADLALTKTASAASVQVGSHLTYTIGVKNNGPNDATGTTVSDPLPAQVGFVSAASSQGSCSGTTTVTCNLGTVTNGGSATVTIVVTAKAAGTATNKATVSSSLADNNTANNSASVSTTITAKPKPKLKLTVSPRRVTAGKRLCFAFKATAKGHGVRGVTVRFAGHHAKTSGSGKARICLKPRAGLYHPRATKSGYRSATATVRVRPKPPVKKTSPGFTG